MLITPLIQEELDRAYVELDDLRSSLEVSARHGLSLLSANKELSQKCAALESAVEDASEVGFTLLMTIGMHRRPFRSNIRARCLVSMTRRR